MIKNKKLIKIIFIISTISLFCFSLNALDLTQKEINWIEEHPVIRLGIGESWVPFIFPRENGEYKGYDVDLINKINEMTGANIEIVPGKWQEMVQQAKSREIDGLAESTASKARSEFFSFTHSYLTQYYALATTPDKLNTIRSEADLKGKTLARVKGNKWLDIFVTSLGEMKHVQTDTEINAFKLVLEGKADASFLTLGMFPEYRKLYFDNIAIAHIFNENEQKLDLLYSIRNDWPELVAILNKALDAISEDEKTVLYKKWFGFSTDDFASWIWTQLTDEESAWLKGHSVIRIAPDPEFPPIEWFDENNNYEGISADFMKMISDALDIEFEVIHCQNWDEILKKAKSREIDMLPAAAQTSNREKYMLFSDPYLIFPGVIITTKSNEDLTSTEKLYNKKVGIVSGYVWYEFFNKDHPDIEIVGVENVTEGLRKVSTNEIDAFIATLPIALYYIEQEGISNLIVAGETEYKTKLSIQTRKDWPVLNSIITKTLKAIPPKKKKEIINNWIYLKPMSIFSNRTFWIITLSGLLLAVLIFMVIIIWNTSLKKQVQLKTRELKEDIAKRIVVEEELQINRDRLKMLNKIIRHDLSNDFLVIKSAINIFKRTTDATMIDEIANRTNKSLKTIANYRKYESFIDSNQGLEEIEVNQLISELIVNFPKITFNIDGKCNIFADDALHSVFENLISNSIKHGDSTKIDIIITSENDICKIKFMDNGSGIPDKIKGKIFDEGFPYGKSSHTGIGLHIIRKTIENYDGVISLADNETSGATFIICLRKAYRLHNSE
ncbi:MAG: transporter substrate-binding domain-containing protein [Candidatus Tenebribacter burtonii]|nr:transporter substrate-binding domain-containing protein [Candidatus Tenebribacter burtonii]